MNLYLNTKRDGYEIEDCDPTVTVAQLISILEGYPGDAPVYLRNDNGYTFGSVDPDDFDLSY